MVRFEGLPGEFAQHDFGQVDVRDVDGRRERIHVFASRLEYSRRVEMTVVPDERVEALVRALIGRDAAWGACRCSSCSIAGRPSRRRGPRTAG